LSSGLLSENINIKIHRAIIIDVVLYGCEIWSLTMMGEHMLRRKEWFIQVLVGCGEGKRQLVRARHTGKDNIKTELQ
jgi:hypothetical protein